eukprot:3983924-Alexandrium_andersonii.AAC.1
MRRDSLRRVSSQASRPLNKTTRARSSPSAVFPTARSCFPKASAEIVSAHTSVRSKPWAAASSPIRRCLPHPGGPASSTRAE